ncbi:sortase-dependent protein [Kitasatospora sp. NPDC048365]|uniref:sortase-dependent protein n=1 Tax=Kitasatospora sp. NPDC048365 TaxID=3364050 RepID=UPI0037188E1C
MSSTLSVRRATRLALVSAAALGVLALPGAVAFADGSASPSPARATPSASPSVAPTAVPSPVPSRSPATQVTAVPKGGAQTGEGAADGGSTVTLVVGTVLAAAGAAGIGLVVVRRRAGAQD